MWIGFYHHRLPIALEAMRQGYEVHIATALTDQLAVLESYGFVVHPLTLNRSGVGIWAIGKPFWQIFRVCKIIKPDVVHFVTIKPVLFGSCGSFSSCARYCFSGVWIGFCICG